MKFFTSIKASLTRRWPRSRKARRVGWLMAVVVSALLVAVPVLSQRQPVVLTMLMNAPDVPVWNKVMVTAFEKANPDIKIRIVEGPNATDLVENMYTTSFLLGESPYDLINMDVIWTPKFAAAGWLMDLTDQFSQKDLSAFSPADVEGGKFQDRLYRIPTRSDASMLYYRTDLLAQNGFQPPQNLEDMARIAKAIQAKGDARWGYLWQGRQYEGESAMFIEILKGFGGFWVNPDTLEVGLDRPETINAINFLKSTIDQGISPPGVTTYMEEDTRRIFQAGDSVFLRNWPYAWPLFNAEGSEIRGKVGIVPMPGSGNREGAACLGGWGLGIAKTTRHPKEALKVLQFMSNLDAQRQFVLDAGYVPSVRNLFTDPAVLREYSHFPQLLKVVDNAVLRPPVAQYAQLSDILQRYLSAALTNQVSPEDAMKEAAGQTRRVLEAGQKG